MTDRLGNSLAFVGGGDRSILNQVPMDRSRFAAMGAALLVAAGLSSISMFFALHNGVQLALVPSLIVCLVWGLIILNLDRFLMLSIRYTRGGARLILVSFLRLILSAVVALVTATPLVLQIFSSDINAQLSLMNARQPHTADNGLLAQLQALSELSSKNAIVETAVVVTFLLFFLISALPVMAKILLSLGPPTAYDQVVKLQEEVILDMARAMRVEKRRIQERKSEAQLVIDEDMRRKEESLGKKANAHVAQHMEAILDVALAEWSRQVSGKLGAAQGPSQGSTGQSGQTAQQSGQTAQQSGQTAQQSGLAFPPNWPSIPSAQTDTGSGFDLPAGREL